MDRSLDDVAFLARSENRVRILLALDEERLDRRELREAVDASRATCSRALTGFEERGWIERDRNGYRTTRAGSIVANRMLSLTETIDGVRAVGDGIEVLPIEELSLDVRHLAGARFVTWTAFEPTAHFEHGIEALERADRLRALVHTSPRPYARAIDEGVASGELAAECVFDGAYLEQLSEDHERRWREIAASPNGEVRTHPGDVPVNLLIVDETVHLFLCTEDGESLGLLESERAAVLEWAESTFDEYRDRSEPAVLSDAR